MIGYVMTNSTTPPIPEAVKKIRYMRVGRAKFKGKSAITFDI